MVQMDMIGLALSFQQSSVFFACNSSHISMKAMAPLLIDSTSPAFGTPDDVQINT
jgi:hypothetical protein